jgi:hypothetical protein
MTCFSRWRHPRRARGRLVLITGVASWLTLLPTTSPGAQGTVTARFTASPVQGAPCVAPCAVHFDAIGDGTTATVDAAFEREFHTLRFEWTFGDPRPSRWRWGPPLSRDKNFAVGAIAGHVYDDPGAYEVVLKVTNPKGDVDTVSQEVVVADPAVVFPDDRTFCIANQPGTFHGCPLDSDGDGACDRSPSHCIVGDDADRYLFETCDADASNGIACLFRGGDRFVWDSEHPGPLGLHSTPPKSTLLGRFGEGKATIQTRGAFTLFANGASWTISHLVFEFDGALCRGWQYRDRDVDVGASGIRIPGHDLQDGAGPYYVSCRGRYCSVPPPLGRGRPYWIIVSDPNFVQLAATSADAAARYPVRLLAGGSSANQLIANDCGLISNWAATDGNATLYDLRIVNPTTAAVSHDLSGRNLTNHADLIAIVDVDVEQGDLGTRNEAGFLLKGERVLLMGGEWDNNYHGEYNLRTAHLVSSVIQHVRMMRPNNGSGPDASQSNVELRAMAVRGVAPDEYIIVSDNVLSHDDPSSWIRTCRQTACGEAPDLSRNIIVERNLAFLSARGRAALTHGLVWSASSDITIRNNIVDLRGLGPSRSLTLFTHQEAPGPPGERNHVLHNTAYYDGAWGGPLFWCTAVAGSGHVCRNNLAYFPGRQESGDGTKGEWEAGDNVFAPSNPFVGRPGSPPEAEAFRLGGAKPIFDGSDLRDDSSMAVQSDYFLGCRPQARPAVGAHGIGAEDCGRSLSP